MASFRAHQGAFRWMRALAFAAVAAAALARMGFYPKPVVLPVVAGIAALGLLSPGIGVAAFVIAVAIPMIAASAISGIAFLVVGLAAVQYLGQDGARPFVVIGLAFAATLLKAEWAVVVLGGYVLGTSEGAVAALVACAGLEVAAILLGAPVMGASVGGGHQAVLAFGKTHPGALTFSWLLPALRSMAPGDVLAAFKGAEPIPVLLLQPVLWAAGAGAASGIARRVSKDGRTSLPLAAAAGIAGASVLGIGAMALKGLGSPVPASSVIGGLIGSCFIAGVGALAFEMLFPRLEPEKEAPSAGVQAEDADVDELLRLIASAEEELAAKHMAETTVMITDMKAFSAMTEEDGSVTSAKRIQRHRDLLLPIIAAHHGRGKSTGGDGLVAAFEDPAEALQASVEMQRTLDAFNASHPGERAILIRIGVAYGEVVLDNGGRPFIGSALNKAARVMNLADGGEILSSSDVASRAGRRAPAVRAKGTHELKNIAGSVEVLEVLWESQEQRAAGA